MLRLLLQKPFTQTEIIKKYSNHKGMKALTSQIIALDARDRTLPGYKFSAFA